MVTAVSCKVERRVSEIRLTWCMVLLRSSSDEISIGSHCASGDDAAVRVELLAIGDKLSNNEIIIY